MSKLKNKILLIVSLIMIITISICNNAIVIKAISNGIKTETIEVGVVLNNFYNPYNLSIKKSLEDIAKENNNNVKFTFFDGKGNEAIENELVGKMFNENYKLLLVAIVDKRSSELVSNFVSKAKNKNVPIIFINTTPADIDVLNGYTKALAINTDSIQAATLQGKLIVDAWNTNKKSMDKNNDDILQYILIQGEPESYAAIVRNQYVIQTINNARIKTEELAKISANWNSDIAEAAIQPLFFRYGDKIEAIISNNDSMAIGTIKALQKYGYNKGNKIKTIPVFGIGAVSEAQELIKKGFMAGSVLQNPRLLAEALYTVGMNLILNKLPLEGTNYKFDKRGKIILIPFEEYKGQDKSLSQIDLGF
ncbi:galactose ABC transporter substrate-binding protein [Clostridium cellulovorans]|uniref:D-galactose/methyl-galactoside binding periplasmic protein MglB n=1 Tax=Clostridium cellulovorans (strain ATCC 35296 / DSM 3052 / OCM 3 / 743B) TaxID=573061 RepID=D9SUL4_CLOC7|nr:galactose ABC transporter substrate-binding protein [Clostridium cellulovorans]ADL50919.1 D-galactose-binding periplasmic protein precursor [Clostridium cellulovorans 743B]